MKFKTQWNADQFPQEQGEKNPWPSLTIPDQSMSVMEIMQRYANGIPFEAPSVGFYDEDDPMPDVRKLDLAEIQDMQDEAKMTIADITEKWEKERQEKKVKKHKEMHDELDKMSEEQKVLDKLPTKDEKSSPAKPGEIS